MTAAERNLDRAVRIGRSSLFEIGRDIREARTARGLSLATVGARMGRSHSYLSRLERGRRESIPYLDLTRAAALVGLDLSLRSHPGGAPLRDGGHAGLLERLHVRVASSLTWATEVPLPNPGDPRAWDAVIRLRNLRVGVEAEVRPKDGQEFDRRLALKRRDGGVDRMIVLLPATRNTRIFLQAYGDQLRARFPVPGRVALEALAEGRDPGGDAIIVL